MKALDAVEMVLRDADSALNIQEITRRIIDRGLWQSSGQTPAATIASYLALDIKRYGATSRFQRIDRGLFTLQPSATTSSIANAPTSVHVYTEAETRQSIIDRQLAQAGWSVERGNLRTEFRLTTSHIAESKTTYQVGDEFVDYVLVGQKGVPLAIIEAKRTKRDPLAGQRQVADYASRISETYGVEPFIFLSNGETIWFADREPFPLRPVSAFFTPVDLERRAFQRQYVYQQVQELGPNLTIAGRDRPYQVEAIKRVTEALSRGQRTFLLVMATGTGKTRTVVALVDLLMRAKWVQRVLFLADRRELVRQALGDFKEYMPNELRARIEGGDVNHAAAIHVATYPSIMQVYKQLSPGYYDLIIADESHRSIYNHYGAVLKHFDALQIGLTATPTDYIDHNTFELFNCPDGLPTFSYPYEAAVQEGYLVNYRVLEAQTTFQLHGIKAGQLPPDVQHQLIEQGIDLSEVNFEGSDLERRVTNTGTNDAIVREFMAKCRKDISGTLPAKTIIFAMSHRHAQELWNSFRRLYPDLHRRGLVELIDSHMERADRMLDDFKRKDFPRVAISVDMLDTGIDVPAIQNLVFAKPVFSQVKFWQMIGRGTRLWTDRQTGQNKGDFLIIDHWNNFAYFNMHPEGETASTSEALPVRLFRTRLEKFLLLRGQDAIDEAEQTITQLQSMLAHVPLDNVNVRPHLSLLHELSQVGGWQQIDPERIAQINTVIAPLLRFTPDVNFQVMTFEARTERLFIALLKSQHTQMERLREQIVADLRLLPVSLREVQAHAQQLHFTLSNGFWDHLSYERICDLQTTFAPLMRFRQHPRQEIIRLHLPDEIVSRRWVIYGPSGEGAFADSYRQQVEAYIRTIADEHPTLQKLRRGDELSQDDIEALAVTLDRADLFITENVLREVYERPDATLVDFLRHILGTHTLASHEEQIKAAFDAFIAAHPRLTATQLNFLRAVRSAVLRRVTLSAADLERPPFSRIGVAQRLFDIAQLDEILALARKMTA